MPVEILQESLVESGEGPVSLQPGRTHGSSERNDLRFLALPDEWRREAMTPTAGGAHTSLRRMVLRRFRPHAGPGLESGAVARQTSKPPERGRAGAGSRAPVRWAAE